MTQPRPIRLFALKAPAPQFDAAAGAEGLPQRILVMPWGEHQTPQGKVVVNEVTLSTLASYNASKNWDRPALDFEHSSVPGSATYRGEPVKVAGYGTLEVVKGEGIYLLMSTWTQEGQAFAAGGHYGDLSPVVSTNDKGEVIGLHSAALCRHGATPGLIFLSSTTTATHSTMDAQPPQNADELYAALKGVLQLGEDATPADVLAGLTSKLTEATKALAAAATAAGEKKEEEPAMKELSATVAELKDTVKLLSATVVGNERQAILNQAAREGKQVPTVAKSLPVDQLKLLCAELPVTVPLEQRTPTQESLMLSGGGAVSASPEAARISTLTKVSDEDRKKYA